MGVGLMPVARLGLKKNDCSRQPISQCALEDYMQGKRLHACVLAHGMRGIGSERAIAPAWWVGNPTVKSLY